MQVEPKICLNDFIVSVLFKRWCSVFSLLGQIHGKVWKRRWRSTITLHVHYYTLLSVLLLTSQHKNLKVKTPLRLPSVIIWATNKFPIIFSLYSQGEVLEAVEALPRRQTCYCAQVFTTVWEHYVSSKLNKSGRRDFRWKWRCRKSISHLYPRMAQRQWEKRTRVIQWKHNFLHHQP